MYTAQSLSLASLEVLVHAEDARVLAAMRWASIPVRFDESLVVAPERIPRNWRRTPSPDATRKFGNDWLASGRSVVLRVPSAVTPREFNYLINPRHADFSKLKIGAAERFSFRYAAAVTHLRGRQNPAFDHSGVLGLFGPIQTQVFLRYSMETPR